jgi:predicted membrane channel-forming protein YqfA (hemolysin III family)
MVGQLRKMQNKITERGFLTTILVSTAIYLIYDAFWNYLSRSQQEKFSTETHLQLLTVVLTNIIGIPALIASVKREYFTESIVGGMSILTSTFYHMAQTAKFPIWSMNDGQWHRLDNVFIILSCQNLVHFILFATSVQQTKLGDTMESSDQHAAHFMHEQRVLNLFRWFGLAFCLTCQERAPWNVIFTVVPIVVPAVLATIRMYLFVPIEYRSRFNSQDILRASLLMACGIFFFILGLDDDNDYLRIKHGLWHAFVGASFYYFFKSKDPSPASTIKKNRD